MKIYAILILTVFLLSCGGSDGGAPYCNNPAPLYGDPVDAHGYIFYVKDDFDVSTEVTKLMESYPMEIGAIYEPFGGFYANMNVEVMEKIRCENSIKSVYYNNSFTID